MANAGLGITIGSHSLRAVAVRKKGESWAVTRAVAQRFDAEGMRDDAGRILGARGVKGAPATLGLSGRDVIIRYSQVPPVPDWRLKNLMKFEVDEVSGQSGGAVSADYRKLNLPDPEGTRGEETVLVALARNAYLDPLLASLSAGGISFEGGCPNSVGLFNAFAVNATYTEDETSLLVNVGAQGMDIAIQRGGELIFARNVSPGGKAFTDAIAAAFSTTPAKAETMKLTKADVTPRGQARYPDPTSEKVANAIMGVAGQFAQVIQSTLMICRAQTKLPDLKVDRVLLAGGGASLKGLDGYLKQAMGVPVERFDPFSACDLSALPDEERQAVEAAPHEYAVVLGLAQTPLAPATFKVAVLPEAVRRRREFATRGVFSLLAAAAAAAALVVIYTSREAAAKDVRAQTSSLRKVETVAIKNDGEFKRELERFQEQREKHRQLAERALPGVLFSNALLVLHQKVVPEVVLEEVTLVIQDKAPSYELLHSLGKSGYTQRSHTHAVRAAVVTAKGRITSGSEQARVFTEFVRALQANDIGLLVRPTGSLTGKYEFGVEIASGISLTPVAEPGSEPGTAWFVQNPVLVDEGGEPAVRGTSADGVVVTVRKDRVAPEDWTRLLAYNPKSDTPAPEKPK